MRATTIVAVFLWGAAGAPAQPQAPTIEDVRPALDALSFVEKIGPAVWPGYGLASIPLAINVRGAHEVLIDHPSPPEGFVDAPALGSTPQRPVFVREGTSFNKPTSGGWTKDIGGHETVYVSTRRDGQSDGDYKLLMLHEGFHVFQMGFRPRVPASARGLEGTPEETAGIWLEAALLKAALDAQSGEERRRLAKGFLAVRRRWERNLDPAVLASEEQHEFMEGSATYAEAAACLAAIGGGLGGSHPAFAREAPGLYEAALGGLALDASDRLTASHRHYRIGAGLCLLLHRLLDAEDWKPLLADPERSLTDALEEALGGPMGPAEADALCAQVEETLGFAAAVEKQRALLDDQSEWIRSVLAEGGRRYLVRIAGLAERPKYTRRGKTVRVPGLLNPTPGEYVSIWSEGVADYRTSVMELSTETVPIEFRLYGLAWIDREPEPDGSDFFIEHEGREGDVLTGVRIITDGFRLTADRARVTVTDDLVVIEPLGP